MSESVCRHLWEPRADAERIWQTCLKCGLEKHITTHEEHTRRTIAYIFRDFGPDAHRYGMREDEGA